MMSISFRAVASIWLASLTLTSIPPVAAQATNPAGTNANSATGTASADAAAPMSQSGGLPPGVHGKRKGPAEVKPVVIGAVRYEVIHFGKAEGLDQNGGYIAALDKKTGARLWTLKVYANQIDPKLESDVQEVFISAMKKHGAGLAVTDERGRHYRVDVKHRTATPH